MAHTDRREMSKERAMCIIHRLTTLALLSSMLGGCAVVGAAGAVAGAAVDVGSAAVSVGTTAVGVAADGVGAAAGAVTGGSSKDDKKSGN
jgi:hypothetical protein